MAKQGLIATNMKIYYLGRRLDGRFDSFKAFVQRVTRVVFRFSVLGALLYGAWFFGTLNQTVIATTTDSLPARVDALKEEMVERLAAECETVGRSGDDGVIIFDANNQASIGRWQWQKKSVIYYYEHLYGEKITPRQAVLIALDDGKAAQLTKDVLFNVEDGWQNWLNCGKKLGLPQEIAIIKKLTN